GRAISQQGLATTCKDPARERAGGPCKKAGTARSVRAAVASVLLADVVVALGVDSIPVANGRPTAHTRPRPHHVTGSRIGRAVPEVTYREAHGVVEPGAVVTYKGRCDGTTPMAIGGFSGTDVMGAVGHLALAESAPSGPAVRD